MRDVKGIAMLSADDDDDVLISHNAVNRLNNPQPCKPN